MEAENKAMKDFLQEDTFYNMMKQNTFFKGDGGLYIDLLIKISKLLLIKINSFENSQIDHINLIYAIVKKKLKSLNQRN